MREKFESFLKKTVNPGKCRESLVGNDYLADVTFKLGLVEEELRAHKFFLMTASPVFHEIFVNNSEVDENGSIELKIAAISRPVMIEICRFAYSEVVALTKENMLDILFAASKFQMKFLVEKTVDFICKEGMSVETVFKILKANQKEPNMRLSLKVFEFIKKNYRNCFDTGDFRTISVDMLKSIMQTCKIPLTAAKDALVKWSMHPDNVGEDLDELFALISLNDDMEEECVEESKSVRDTDTESVSSKMSSRAGSNNNRTNGHHNQRVITNSKGNQRKPQLQTAKLNFSLKPGLKMFSIFGSDSRKNYKFANLDLQTFGCIFINEIHFIYDLSTTDRDFELKIMNMSAKSSPLFYMQVDTSQKFDGKFIRYVLPRPCEVPGNSKIWISIAFKSGEFRLTRERLSSKTSSGNNQLALRDGGDQGGKTHSGQLIDSIVFKDALVP